MQADLILFRRHTSFQWSTSWFQSSESCLACHPLQGVIQLDSMQCLSFQSVFPVSELLSLSVHPKCEPTCPANTLPIAANALDPKPIHQCYLYDPLVRVNPCEGATRCVSRRLGIRTLRSMFQMRAILSCDPLANRAPSFDQFKHRMRLVWPVYGCGAPARANDAKCESLACAAYEFHGGNAGNVAI